MTPRDAARAFAIAVALVVIAQAHGASGGVFIRKVDTGAYPAIRATIVSSAGSRAVPRLTEDGSPVAALRAVNLGRAKSVVLAIDRSQSMAGRSLASAAAAARAFLAGKPRADEISIVALASRATQLTGFSTATIDADTALRTLAVDPKAGTALYDAVVLASQSLAAQPLPGRVLIVLTDGSDVSSHATLADAVDAARRAGVVVYPVGIESRDFSRAPLEELARATGGRYLGTTSPSALAAIYARIAAELGRTWTLTYATAARPGERIDLRASVPGAGSAAVSLAIPSGGSLTAPATGRAAPFAPGLYGRFGTAAVALAAGLLVLAASAFALPALRPSRLRARIAAHVDDPGARRRARRGGRGSRAAALAPLFRATERTLGHRHQWLRLQRRLEQGAVPLRTVEFVYAAVGTALLLGLVAAALGASPLLLLGAAVLGGLVPHAVVSLRVRKRLAAFETQLPDLLVTMAASLKAGHSFKQGIQAAVDEDAPPASDEFRRVMTEAALGRPIEAALGDMAQRVGSRNFEFVITAVTIQRQVGGSLAGLFDLVADTVRQRQQAARKIRSLTAMGRMSAYVLLGLPIVVALALSALNPGYMRPLYTTSTGHLLLGIGFSMMAIGALILRRIVSFRG